MTTSRAPIRRGPPNRMNDLDYKTWMKFQKSFFRYSSWQALVTECIHFFTKSTWDDGAVSRSLIIGAEDFDSSQVLQPRAVDVDFVEDWDGVLGALERASTGSPYDFAFIDLRMLVNDQETLTRFLASYATQLSSRLRQILGEHRYCGFLINGTDQVSGGAGFPLPWSVAAACRGSLKLRDEKVGLIEKSKTLVYCLFMQSEDDGFESLPITPEKLVVAKHDHNIPAWVIPKPPPRKKNEILHPAKYPETLIETFIDLFTTPSANVFDPMVGTGSTVLAAIRSGRNGYGVDLIQEFVDIANERIRAEKQPMLFPEFETTTEALVVQGDSTHLSEVEVFEARKFDYTVTSPPYWSMLSNPGSENQRARRNKSLRLVYSDNEQDLGNVQDYQAFLVLLADVYNQVADKSSKDGKLTIVAKNVKRDHTLYTLAWDLVSLLCREGGRYAYLGTTLWCQDDIGLKPFAVGIHWVSNTLHNYCLHLQVKH